MTRWTRLSAPLGGKVQQDWLLRAQRAVTELQNKADELAAEIETVAGSAGGGSGTDPDAVHTGDAAGGDLGGTYPNPTVTQARGLRETGGPTTLTMGAVANNEYLMRSGSSIVGGTPSGGSGRTLVGTYTVSGSAKQHIVFGPSGDIVVTFATGRRYRIEARVGVTTNPTITLDPNSQTADIRRRFLFSTGVTASANEGATGAIYGDTGNEHVEIVVEWSELAGFYRIFDATHLAINENGPDIDSFIIAKYWWNKTPAQTAMGTFRLGGSGASSFDVGSKITLFDLGPC